MQAPATHMSFGATHARPQDPQLVASVCVFVSQPFAADPSQSAKPALQSRTEHVPAMQPGVSFSWMHALPQNPQLSVSVRVSM